MSLQSKILLVCAIGAALLIAGCGSRSSNTSVTSGQAADVGTEIMANVLQTFKNANGTNGVEPAPSEAKRAVAAVVANPSCTAGVCTYATTALPCVYGSSVEQSGVLTAVQPGQASLGGTTPTFTESLNTTTGIETVDITPPNSFILNFASPASAALGCSYDDILVLTEGTLAVTGTGIEFDTNTGYIVLPFTLTATTARNNNGGVVTFEPGAADPTFPAGQCQANITAEYEFQTPNTCAANTALVQAAVSGTICGKTIPASQTVTVGCIATPTP
jgi:hypothetical protein